MAQECIVCGERLRGFMVRGINKQLRRTVELTEKCREVADGLEREGSRNEGGDATGVVDVLRGYVREGEGFVEFWHDSAHGVGIPDPSEVRVIKREWVAWGKQARGALSFVSLSPEKMRQIMARG